MRTFIFTFITVLAVFVQNGYSQTAADYKRVSAADFIIFPWGGMPEIGKGGIRGETADFAKTVKDLYDAGINCTGFIAPDKVKYTLGTDIAVFIQDGRIGNGVLLTVE